MTVSSEALLACASEQIHVPGAIQPHGLLFVLDEPSLVISQASENAEPALDGISSIVGCALSELWPELARALESVLDTPLSRPTYAGTVDNKGAKYDALVHRYDGALVLELLCEATDVTDNATAIQELVRDFVLQMRPVQSVDTLCDIAARQMQRITGFGRVLVYCFDAEGHGEVLGESVQAGYTSYAGHRFPASDIPQQARRLYELNHFRIIPDAQYTPQRILPALNPRTGKPTDLTFAALRSVSPVHVEYMRNMGTASSMSVSIIVRERLWGLISCHHHTPRNVSLGVRVAAEHLGQLLSLQLEAKESYHEAEHGIGLRRLLLSVVASLAEAGGSLEKLITCGDDLLRFGNAVGVAVVSGGEIHVHGSTPSNEEITELSAFIADQKQEVWASDKLHEVYPKAAHFAVDVGGVLAISVSQLHDDFVIWFRPEVIRTVQWAGNPAKAFEDGRMRLHPRRSFDTWREQVRGRSDEWRESELHAAAEFRNALLNVVLRRAEETASLANELRRINRELEAFSYSVSHDLRAPLRHITGYADLIRENESAGLSERGMRFIQNIKEAARFAGTLVDDLLAFSQMGRTTLRPVQVDMRALVEGVVRNIRMQPGRENIEFVIGELPMIHADPVFMQVAMENLIGNAVKYTATRPSPRIEISGESTADGHRVTVSDNGVGFDMKYAGKLFGIFQRLHRIEEFEGTGIGLASVRRAVERHGGTVSAYGELGVGASFSILMPREISSTV